MVTRLVNRHWTKNQNQVEPDSQIIPDGTGQVEPNNQPNNNTVYKRTFFSFAPV